MWCLPPLPAYLTCHMKDRLFIGKRVRKLDEIVLFESICLQKLQAGMI